MDYYKLQPHPAVDEFFKKDNNAKKYEWAITPDVTNTINILAPYNSKNDDNDETFRCCICDCHPKEGSINAYCYDISPQTPFGKGSPIFTRMARVVDTDSENLSRGVSELTSGRWLCFKCYEKGLKIQEPVLKSEFQLVPSEKSHLKTDSVKFYSSPVEILAPKVCDWWVLHRRFGDWLTYNPSSHYNQKGWHFTIAGFNVFVSFTKNLTGVNKYNNVFVHDYDGSHETRCKENADDLDVLYTIKDSPCTSYDVYFEEGFQYHRQATQVLAKLFISVHVDEYYHYPWMRRLLEDEDYVKYISQLKYAYDLKSDSFVDLEINPKLYIKFLPLYESSKTMVRDHFKKLSRCDLCDKTDQVMYDYNPSSERVYKRSSYKSACNFYMYGVDGYYGCCVVDGYGGLKYTGNTGNLWRSGKLHVCDGCLLEMLNEDLLIRPTSS